MTMVTYEYVCCNGYFEYMFTGCVVKGKIQERYGSGRIVDRYVEYFNVNKVI